jgi:type II secretory pathway pseudopilin PulG
MKRIREVERRGGRGFSLLEMLIVIAIIMVLAGLLIGIIANVQKKKQATLAEKQISDIKGAGLAYFEEMGGYPTDTGYFTNWSAPPHMAAFPPADDNIRPDMVVRELATAFYDATGKLHGPLRTQISSGMCRTVNFGTNYKLWDANGAITTYSSGQIMLDPWGTPYQYDAVHIRQRKVADPNNPGLQLNESFRVGPPCPPAQASDPQRRQDDYKVWSNGPDGLQGAIPFSQTVPPYLGVDIDNLKSW